MDPLPTFGVVSDIPAALSNLKRPSRINQLTSKNGLYGKGYAVMIDEDIEDALDEDVQLDEQQVFNAAAAKQASPNKQRGPGDPSQSYCFTAGKFVLGPRLPEGYGVVSEAKLKEFVARFRATTRKVRDLVIKHEDELGLGELSENHSVEDLCKTIHESSNKLHGLHGREALTTLERLSSWLNQLKQGTRDDLSPRDYAAEETELE
eukprot:gene25003-30488_t